MKAMNRQSFELVAAVVAVLVLPGWAASPAHADDAQSELELKPCTVELVDGTTVEGQLAVQFDMDDHLIVYSPRLATVRSFLKDHVYALTVDGQRKQLNPKRELTDEDRKLLGQVDWPDAPPDEGFKPAYTTEKWDKPRRLLVWAAPGRTGRSGKAENWLENGRPMQSLQEQQYMFEKQHGRPETRAAFGPDTDVLVPVAAEDYQVRSGAAWKPGSDRYITRHITVENGALCNLNINGCNGNVWIAPDGKFDGGGNAPFRGDKHTFLYNGLPRQGHGPVTDPQQLEAKHLARKWELRKDDPDASMEVIGGARSGDETHVRRGRLIVAENSNILVGPRCVPVVEKDAALILHSGSYFGKWQNQPETDTEIRGTLLAGTPDRPLTRDCYFGIGCSDWTGEIRESQLSGKQLKSTEDIPMHIGLVVAESAKVRVHSADPTRARIVFDWHGDASSGMDNGAAYIRIRTEREKAMWAQVRGRISAAFAGDVQFEGVVFDHFYEGGIMLADMNMRDQWTHVYFGDHNHAEPSELFAPIPKHLQVSGGERSGNWEYPEDAPIPDITPVPEAYVAGVDTVRVTIDADAGPGAEIRYTLDGSIPDSDAPVYTGPITLSETTVIKARCFQDGQRLGPPRRVPYPFTEAPSIEPTVVASSEPGLAAEFYKKPNRYTSRKVFEESPPEKTDVVDQVSLNPADGDAAAIIFRGYLDVKEKGVYHFEAITDRPRTEDAKMLFELTLGDQEIFQNPWVHAPEGDVRRIGVARLKPGRYKLTFKAITEGKRLELQWKGPGIDKQPIRADALSH
jgi:hypothetical protein